MGAALAPARLARRSFVPTERCGALPVTFLLAIGAFAGAFPLATLLALGRRSTMGGGMFDFLNTARASATDPNWLGFYR